jgi:hypothetical protein
MGMPERSIIGIKLVDNWTITIKIVFKNLEIKKI